MKTQTTQTTETQKILDHADAALSRCWSEINIAIRAAERIEDGPSWAGLRGQLAVIQSRIAKVSDEIEESANQHREDAGLNT